MNFFNMKKKNSFPFLASIILFSSVRFNTTWRSHWFSSAQNFPIHTEHHSIKTQFKSLIFKNSNVLQFPDPVCIYFIWNQSVISRYFFFFFSVVITVGKCIVMGLKTVEKFFFAHNSNRIRILEYFWFAKIVDVRGN